MVKKEKEDDEFYVTPFMGQTEKEPYTNEQQLLQQSSISIVLKDYNDIFSDFDPRPYSQRALSHDFLPEIKRAVQDQTSGVVELRLLIPEDQRSVSTEAVIKQRLKDHFKRHNELLNVELRGVRVTGILMVVIGAILGVIATWLYGFEEKSFLFKFILILMEPASWFSIWEGMYHIFFEAKDILAEFKFYHKMTKSEIKFNSY